MIALIDCNNFFCSVERTFHAGLSHKPVCVLSSNDGCVVALSQEAKDLGIKRGVPLFKIKNIVERNDVKIFSSNMYLYATMSKRISHILRESVSKVERYSIDECFCYLNGYDALFDMEGYMRSVADKIRLWTDVPVSIGVAPTKTLAKIGSKFAKKHKGYSSVCLIDNEEKRRKALSLFDLEDVWGIGRQTLDKLRNYGVFSTLDFADKKESWVKARFTLPTLKTWKELNGFACIDTSEIIQKQRLCTSRSFGDMVSDLPSLKASVASFADSCANKLRGQDSLAGSVTVFVMSNRFRKDLPQYFNYHTVYFPIATADTLEIADTAISALCQIFKKGILYKKSGVILRDISNAQVIQQHLFDTIKNRSKRMSLMKTIDTLNQNYGLKKIHLAVEGPSQQAWHCKSEFCSGNYMSNVNELLTIHI